MSPDLQSNANGLRSSQVSGALTRSPCAHFTSQSSRYIAPTQDRGDASVKCIPKSSSASIVSFFHHILNVLLCILVGAYTLPPRHIHKQCFFRKLYQCIPLTRSECRSFRRLLYALTIKGFLVITAFYPRNINHRLPQMSVKFEKETIRDTIISGGSKTDIAHAIGERITGGKGQTGYLAVS